ncbi:MAG: DNA-binding response regulator [Candidatus Kapaibacterium sp.]|nr:MAG: DNA-binding response regulator [Candidatus Kapabacteria bacterium]
MRILVIEDEKKVASFIRKGLSEEMYAVDVAGDGELGVQMATETTYDAIILDVMLPKKDGLQVLRELRSSGSATPVLMLTARASTQDRVTGLDLGADDYLTKPFHFEELAARVRSLLRRTSTEKTTMLTCGDLSLDTVTHRAYRGGKEIDLTTKEYSLLEYLIRNKGRVLSRSLIQQHVWSYSFDTESNIIDVYVKRLRGKINDEGKQRLIRSIRGVGYVMREPDTDSDTGEDDDE